ncbi:MAG: carboxypeptidase regulatory-like domain-containing protein, partial [Acidobacteria bacterium]|nr:carboxypeptidase regulatory-like domain-containing protein [Acidobacteriota bacterium]
MALLALPLAAQITTGEITGTVSDSAGAVIAGATVTATNPATNTTRTATTSGAGVYNVPALPPGSYSLRVEMQGFTPVCRAASLCRSQRTGPPCRRRHSRKPPGPNRLSPPEASRETR